MDPYLRDLEDTLPEPLRKIPRWEFLPWGGIKKRHTGPDDPALTALLQSYQRLAAGLDLPGLTFQPIPRDAWGCERCAHCCIYMRPGPVPASTFRRWMERDAPVAWFYRPVTIIGHSPRYHCWYQGEVRLKMCPFLLINLRDGRPFCSIYHMGDDLRPSTCSNFKPRHEKCRNGPLEVQPWESA